MARTAWMTENEPTDADIRGEILRQLMLIGKNGTICPSEVARELFQPWREKMDRVREVVSQMVVDGTIDVLQRGVVVELEKVKGPVRLKLR